MKKHFVWLLWGMLLPACFLAQELTILEKSSLSPLPGVLIIGKVSGRQTITNSSGRADLNSFPESDSLQLSLTGYFTRFYTMAELKAMDFKTTLIEKSFELEEAVVSASRFEEKRKDVAQPVQVLKSRDIAFASQPTTADVIQNSGNVFVQKSQLGGGSPVIRGFETNKVLMVVDGVRMNNAIYRGGHLQNIITIDNAVMEKAEIIFGPGSVVYGSDALGGVMHFYTKNPQLSDTGVKISSNVFSRFATASNEVTGHFDISAGGEKFGSFTSITYSQFGDLRQGTNRVHGYSDWGKRPFYIQRINGRDSMLNNPDQAVQRMSGYSQYDILQKFLFRQSDRVSHVMNLQYSSSSDIPRYDRLTLTSGNGEARFAEWYYGPQERLFASYSMLLKSEKGIYDNARLIAGYQKIEESRHDRNFRSANLNHRTENLGIITLNADLAKKVRKSEFRYGIDGWLNDIKSTATRDNIVAGTTVPLDTRYPSGGSAMRSIAAYLTHAYEAGKMFIINDGIRFSHVQLDAEFGDTTFYPFPFRNVMQRHTAVNGNLGLVFFPHAGWRMTLLGSSGFRAPNVDDLSKVFESVPGSVVVPNPDVEPEYTYNAEFGFSKTIKKRVTIGATVYNTLYRNAITTRPGKFNGLDSIVYSGQLSRVTMNVNAAESNIRGVNAYLFADITSAVSVYGNLNYTHGRIKTDSVDYPLDHIPPMFGKCGINIKLRKFRADVFMMYNGAKRSEDYNLVGEDNQSYSAEPVKGYMPAWKTYNVRMAYQFSKWVALQVSAENILDVNYRVFASNISAPGRNFIVTLKGTF